jgi:hypothetical protein
MASPALSLVLCSRNDAYMGNSRWRLETALNYVGGRVASIGAEDRVEVIVADWGSEVPLRDAVALAPAAARITKFLTIPATLARELQGDSPFPEVLALNAAARRARGEYIGRIDQDTLTGERFLRWCLALTEDHMLFFANRRSIPYRLAVRCPPLHVIERFIARQGRQLHIETGRVFYNIDVGIWLAHRRLWDECGGYDERMIYMNDMEIDMVTRLMSKYPIVNLGKIIDYDFYHLDHYHPKGSRSSSTHRKVNTHAPREFAGFRPSGDAWGLAAHMLDLSPQQDRRSLGGGVRSVASGEPEGSRYTDLAVYAAFSAYTGFRVRLDRIIYPFYPVWKRRAAIAWATVRGQSVTRWPALLRKIWVERPSARGPSS